MNDIERDKTRIRATLLAINACETMDIELNGGFHTRVAVEYARDVLYWLKNEIGQKYETNEQLQVFDQVFIECGWFNQGLRWTLTDPDSPEDVFIVEFTDDKHEEWTL